MRICHVLLLSLWHCYCTLVVEVPFNENDLDQKTTLTFNDDIEISNPMTFCIRFKLNDYVTPIAVFVALTVRLVVSYKLLF